MDCLKEDQIMNQEVESKIVAIFRKSVEENTMEYDTLVEAPLSTLNLNSITFIKIIVETELEFDIEIDPENLDISVFKNIKSFTQCVETKLAEA